MAASSTLIVKIVTDTSRASQDVGKFQQTMGKMAVPAAVAGAAVLAFGKQAFDAASRTQQAMGAVESVFGKSAGTIKKWAADAAGAVGLAKSEYSELASVLGSQLKNMGLPMDQVVAKTGDLIKMGADLSATYGGTTAEAVEALSSALRGETDPIEKYGIAIKQADIAAKMAADGTDKLEGAAGKQAKTMALLALANEQSAAAQGAFGREADTAAGQQQRMTAQIENAKSAIGTGLLPVVALLAGKLAVMAKWAEQNSRTVQILVGVIGALAAAVLLVNIAFKLYAAGQMVAAAAQWAFNAAMAANPIGLVIIAVIALVAAFVILYKKSDSFRKLVDTVWAGIKTGAKAAAAFLKKAFQVAWSAISAYVRAYLAVIRFVFGAIKTAASTIAAVVKMIWRGAWDAIKSAAQTLRDAVRAVWGAIKDKAGEIAGWVEDKWKAMWTAIKTAATTAKTILLAPFQAVENIIEDIISAISRLVSSLKNIKVPKINLPGPLSVGGSAAMVVPSVRTSAAVAPAAAGPGGGITINVTGAIDPEATARQIRRILDGHSRRVGLAT